MKGKTKSRLWDQLLLPLRPLHPWSHALFLATDITIKLPASSRLQIGATPILYPVWQLYCRADWSWKRRARSSSSYGCLCIGVRIITRHEPKAIILNEIRDTEEQGDLIKLAEPLFSFSLLSNIFSVLRSQWYVKALQSLSREYSWSLPHMMSDSYFKLRQRGESKILRLANLAVLGTQTILNLMILERTEVMKVKRREEEPHVAKSYLSPLH